MERKHRARDANASEVMNMQHVCLLTAALPFTLSVLSDSLLFLFESPALSFLVHLQHPPPLSLWHEVLFTNHLRPNYTQLAPQLFSTGALEGQNIQTLTDVNLHDFLASISTAVVCLLPLYRKSEEEEREIEKMGGTVSELGCIM